MGFRHECLVEPTEGLPPGPESPEFLFRERSVAVDPVAYDEMPPDIRVPDRAQCAEGYDAHQAQE